MGRFTASALTLGSTIALALAVGPTATASAADTYNFSAQQTLINQDRAANGGLVALAWNNCLANIAQQNADRIAAQGYLSHTNGPSLDLGCLAGATNAGENIAYDSSGIDDSLANTMFMNSAPHRANILGTYTLVATAWTVAPNGYGYIAEEFLNAPVPVADPFAAMVTVDAFGGVHPDGSTLLQGLPTQWPGWPIAQSGALLPDGSGGYMLDGFGGLHPFGAAAAVTISGYWNNWNIARDVAILPGSTATTAGGYVLDGFGGLHPFGGAPAVQISGYWANWDIAKRLAILSDGTGGYVLDGFGGLHPFAIGGSAMPPAVTLGGYWSGWSIVGSFALAPGSTAAAVAGVTLDGYGGVHPFAGGSLSPAAVPVMTAYWPNWNIARAVTLSPSSTPSNLQGWVLDGYGGTHPFGGAPTISSVAYWPGSDRAVNLLVR
jgi:cysteine-rich secretory family protein